MRDVDLAATKGAPNLVKYRAAPFTGFFLDHADFKHDSSNYTGRMEYIYKMQNMTFGDDGALMASCKVCHSNDPHTTFVYAHFCGQVTTLTFLFSFNDVLNVASPVHNVAAAAAVNADDHIVFFFVCVCVWLLLLLLLGDDVLVGSSLWKWLVAVSSAPI